MNFYITVCTQLSIDRSVNVGLRIFILGVPGKVLWSMCHSIHFLTEVGVSLYQHKRWASWEANGFCGISIRTAAIFDASVTVIVPFRKRATSFVIVIVIFIIPTNVCLLEICYAWIELFIWGKMRGTTTIIYHFTITSVEHNKATECEKYATILRCRKGEKHGRKAEQKNGRTKRFNLWPLQVFRHVFFSNDWNFKRRMTF